MGICGFCSRNLFGDDDWDGDWIDHHSDASTWAQAIVSESCPICTLLWQKSQASDASLLGDHSGAAKETRIQQIVRTLRSCRLPVFRVRLRDQASGDFLLSFLSNIESTVTPVVTVNFIIYPLDGESNQSSRYQEHILTKSRTEHEANDRKFIGINTSSAQAFAAIKSWVEACNKGDAHSNCKVIRDRLARVADSTSPGFVPTRLLDVGSSKVPSIRLIPDTNSAGVRGPYTSLRCDHDGTCTMEYADIR
jgi:hypothetical protein